MGARHRVAATPTPPNLTAAPKQGVAGQELAPPGALAGAQPIRPDANLPPMYDVENIRRFADEFEAIPLPSEDAAKAHMLDCHAGNMTYIPSNKALPAVLPYADFFQRMANHHWRAAQPNVGAQRTARPMGAHRDLVANPLMVDRSRKPFGVARDWALIPGLQRVSAYVFRGDKRHPTMVKADGGFLPPSRRTDDRYINVIASKFVEYMQQRYGRTVDTNEAVAYIKGQGPSGRTFVEFEMWRELLSFEEMHIGRMVASEFLKGFVSTSRDVRVAYDFRTQGSADGYNGDSAVYALHSEGGFLLPPRAQHVHGTKENEAEIAHPGILPWSHVMAFRTYLKINFSDARTFKKTGVIFFRKGFRTNDPVGFAHVFAALGSLSAQG